MELKCANLLMFNLLVILNIQFALQCPMTEITDTKKIKVGDMEIPDRSQPITIDKIKKKMKELGVFDAEDPTLTDMERKELNKLFDAVEIMTTSRARQPFNVQTMFTALRLVERAVKKQVKEQQISESLAAKFHWNKINMPSHIDLQEKVIN